VPEQPSSTAEERLVKRVIARFRCEHCNRQHTLENVNVMGKYEAVWVVGVACDGCQRPGMFVVSMRKDSSFERVTDLTEERDRYVLTLEWIRDFAAARDHSIGMGSISRNADAALEAARLREGPE